jgi:hypothetical protein
MIIFLSANVTTQTSWVLGMATEILQAQLMTVWGIRTFVLDFGQRAIASTDIE